MIEVSPRDCPVAHLTVIVALMTWGGLPDAHRLGALPVPAHSRWDHTEKLMPPTVTGVAVKRTSREMLAWSDDSVAFDVVSRYCSASSAADTRWRLSAAWE